MSHFKIILETNPMICLCNKYPNQNTLEYKTKKVKGMLVSKIILKCDMNHLDRLEHKV
jgi:hypothetical protein